MTRTIYWFTDRYVVRDAAMIAAIDRLGLPISGYIVNAQTLNLAQQGVNSISEMKLQNQGRFLGSVNAQHISMNSMQTTTFKVPLKSWTCSYCSKMFRSRSEFRRHTRVHTGERPFPCSVCNARFKQKSHLKVHLRAHLKRQAPETSSSSNQFLITTPQPYGSHTQNQPVQFHQQETGTNLTSFHQATVSRPAHTRNETSTAHVSQTNLQRTEPHHAVPLQPSSKSDSHTVVDTNNPKIAGQPLVKKPKISNESVLPEFQ
mmetsp:Transcript_11405/g.15783  ORF Transcript_11405/g.15783 Transcript_11405/m.15783 type:complete len:260 (+) Transcript_11405:27-806(+)